MPTPGHLLGLSGPEPVVPGVFVLLIVLVRPILVVAALTAEELAAAGWALGDVAAQVVEAGGEDPAVAATLPRPGPAPLPELLAVPR